MAIKRYPLVGLRLLRENRNLSQVALGKALGVSAQSISRYEAQLRFPRVDCLGNLADILQCEIWQLFHPDPVEARQDICWAQAMKKDGSSAHWN